MTGRSRGALGPLLWLAGALAVIVAVALISPTGGDDNDPSSRSAGRAGTLALYSWLGDGELGLAVHRVSGEFDLTGTDVLVVSQPTAAFTGPELDTLDRFVRDGGELIAAVDDLALAQPLLDRLHVAPARPVAAGDAVPVQPIDPGGRIRRVPVT
ncbi:MAG TPA: DUF4350 domain-containing protein [Candidatus Dormibacteraeota bacterium]|nr:DUF4350 domain-containing protein [Candidatus Dormibacteraeota bacterium]